MMMHDHFTKRPVLKAFKVPGDMDKHNRFMPGQKVENLPVIFTLGGGFQLHVHTKTFQFSRSLNFIIQDEEYPVFLEFVEITEPPALFQPPPPPGAEGGWAEQRAGKGAGVKGAKGPQRGWGDVERRGLGREGSWGAEALWAKSKAGKGEGASWGPGVVVSKEWEWLQRPGRFKQRAVQADVGRAGVRVYGMPWQASGHQAGHGAAPDAGKSALHPSTTGVLASWPLSCPFPPPPPPCPSSLLARPRRPARTTASSTSSSARTWRRASSRSSRPWRPRPRARAPATPTPTTTGATSAGRAAALRRQAGPTASYESYGGYYPGGWSDWAGNDSWGSAGGPGGGGKRAARALPAPPARRGGGGPPASGP